MIILITGGFLGAGKTTFINYFLNRVSASGRLSAAVLVNEFGEIPVDTVLIEKGGLAIREVTGGCICCSLKGQLFDSVKEIKAALNPDLLVIEATGLAVPSEIAQTVRAAAEGLITELLCVKPVHYLKAAGKLAVYDRQLAGAKTILLSGAVDRPGVEPGAREDIITELASRNPKGRIFTDSAAAADYLLETVSAPVPRDSTAQPIHEHLHGHPAGSTGGGEVKQDICQVTRRLQSPVNLPALEEEIRLAAERGGEGIFRIKGVVETSEGWQAVQFVEDRMEVKPVTAPPGGESFVVFIGLSGAVEGLEL